MGLSVPIPYLTGSRLAAIGFWGLLVVRVTNLAWGHRPFDLWVLALVALPFVVMQVRRRPQSWATALVMIAATASIFVAGSLFTLGHGWAGLWAVFQVSLLAAIIAAASWPPGRQFEQVWRTRVLGPAWIVLIVIGAILSFDDAWRPVTIRHAAFRDPPVAISGLVAIGCAAFASILAIRLGRGGQMAAAAGAGSAILVLAMHVLAMFDLGDGGWIAFNLWLLAVGTLSLIEGTRLRELSTANRGLLAVGALIAARFFDTDLSFLARGIAFVSFGAACFVLNIWLMRRVRKTST